MHKTLNVLLAPNRRLLVTAVSLLLVLSFPIISRAQLKPEDLQRDYFVKLVLKDSSAFYANILAKPLPDRVIVETRQGRLEIPLSDIEYAFDYRFNFVQRDDVRDAGLKNGIQKQNSGVDQFARRPKAPWISTVITVKHDSFKGSRILFDDSANVLLETKYGTLFFTYPDLKSVENWGGEGDVRDEFLTTAYLTVFDPLASQAYITPTANPIGAGSFFIADYLLAGLQFNYGPTDWLSTNAGGLFLPFLPTQVLTATAGLKVTPYERNKLAFALGVQGVYSEVVKITRIGFPYVAATYGSWSSNINVLVGASYKREADSTGLPYNARNLLLAISSSNRVGENLKFSTELFFIEDFAIVPALFSMRYFDQNMTVDIGVVFSLFKSGAARKTKTLGEYVFNADLSIIPLVSASYHF